MYSLLFQVRLDFPGSMIRTRLEVEPRHYLPLFDRMYCQLVYKFDLGIYPTYYVLYYYVGLGQIGLDPRSALCQRQNRAIILHCQELLKRKSFSGTFFLGFWPEGPKPKEKNVPEKLFLLRGFHRTDCQLVYMFDLADLVSHMLSISLCQVRLGQVKAVPTIRWLEVEPHMSKNQSTPHSIMLGQVRSKASSLSPHSVRGRTAHV